MDASSVRHRAMRELVKAAQAQGWNVYRTPNNHLCFASSDKSQPLVYTSGTPSDHRAAKNVRAILRKYGLSV